MPSPIKIILRRELESTKGSVEVKGPGEESETYWFDLPWHDPTEWYAVFLSLELQEENPNTWPKGDIRKKAQELGLFLRDQDSPSNERFRIIGQALYDAVFGSEKIRRVLDRLFHTQNGPPVLEFHIQDEGSVMQAYPWELLCENQEFLFRGKRVFPVRHIDFSEPITHIELSKVLKVLYIAPRPDISSYEDYANLPSHERLHLEYLNYYYPDHLVLESLPANTLDDLQKYFIGSKNHIHVVHIDTHGGFGWLCQRNQCKQLNSPKADQCSRCKKPRSIDQKNQGYLAFETDGRGLDWISGDDLGERLHRRGVQVIILSACRSGIVGGSSTFNSVAGSLIKQQIPAVVAMQFSIEIKQAEKFTEFLYWALMNGMSLVEAVAEARIALSKDSWYRPVLYLRTDEFNCQGKIFESKSLLGPPAKLELREMWTKRLGFRRDPFLYRDGGIDPFLQEYFYRGMRHFYEIQGNISQPGTVLAFGPSGIGKSSMRNVIAQLCLKDDIIPIVYQDFGPLVRSHEGEKVKVENHVVQILKIALRTIADMAKELEEKVRSFPETEESKIIRNQLWFYASKYEDDPLRRQTLKNLLKPEQETEENLPTDARALLGRFCRYVTKLLGYQFVYILVDPANDIAPDKGIAWQVLEPLLSTHRLLELFEDQVAFKFFLSQKFQEQALQIPWIAQEQGRRVYKLEWPDEELRALLQERLAQCSEGRRKRLEDLTEGTKDLDNRVIQLSLGSPRELIVICDRLFSEHCRNWSPDDGEHLLITTQEVDEALEPFERQCRVSALEQLIAQEESEQLEFKSTMRYNRKSNPPGKDKEMEREVARTLCAFMNTEGGTLIIGIEDNGTVLGLDEDFSVLGRRQNKDGFEQAFVNITENLFSFPLLPQYYTAHFENIQNKLVYVVEVKRGKKQVFCLFDGVKEFYIRKQTATVKLDIEETLEYCSGRFE